MSVCCLLRDHLVLSYGPLGVRRHPDRLLKQLEEVDYLVQVRLLDRLCQRPNLGLFLHRLRRTFLRRLTWFWRKDLVLLEAANLLQVGDDNLEHHLLQDFRSLRLSYLLLVAHELGQYNFGDSESRLTESGRVRKLFCERRGRITLEHGLD